MRRVHRPEPVRRVGVAASLVLSKVETVLRDAFDFLCERKDI